MSSRQGGGVRREIPGSASDPAGHADSSDPAAADVLTTARLRLTPLAVADAVEMADVLSDTRLYRFTGDAPPTIGELAERYERQEAGRSPDGAQIWRNWIARTAAGTAVGFLQATITGDGARAEVAWVIGTAHQRGGYASEAAAAVVGWLRRAGVDEVIAHIHPGNLPSQIIARRAGLTPTGVLHDGEIRWSRRFGHPGHPAAGEPTQVRPGPPGTPRP